MRGGCGARLALPATSRPDWALFGEYPAQVWAAVHPDDVAAFDRAAQEAQVPAYYVGNSGGEVLEIESLPPLSLSLLVHAFANQSPHVRS